MNMRGQPVPKLPIHLERLRLPAAAIQRQHQVRVDLLAQRLVGSKLAQLADEPGVPARRELCRQPIVDDRQT
jgi:hypothetical protein